MRIVKILRSNYSVCTIQVVALQKYPYTGLYVTKSLFGTKSRGKYIKFAGIFTFQNLSGSLCAIKL